jgi:hypothetical protein
MMRRHDDDEGDGPHLNAVDIWVSRHGGKIVTVLVVGLTSWLTLKANVNTKVGNDVFTHYVIQSDSVQRELLTELRELRGEVRSLHNYLCRGKQNDLGCQPE